MKQFLCVFLSIISCEIQCARMMKCLIKFDAMPDIFLNTHSIFWACVRFFCYCIDVSRRSVYILLCLCMCVYECVNLTVVTCQYHLH